MKTPTQYYDEFLSVSAMASGMPEGTKAALKVFFLGGMLAGHGQLAETAAVGNRLGQQGANELWRMVNEGMRLEFDEAIKSAAKALQAEQDQQP